MGVKLSIVGTLYYSEKYLTEFYARMKRSVLTITDDYEILFVNDGSPDNSGKKVLEIQQQDSRVVLIDLSRNFGHHQAILAGLQHAEGDYVFLIDTDLEEDPELLATFWQTMQSNNDIDVVYGLQRKRKGGFLERTSGSVFYKLLALITNFEYPANTLTARVMKRSYVQGVLQFTERTLDVWSLFVMAGFNQVGVEATKGHKGKSTYTFLKKLKMSIEIITSLSHRPLYAIFFLGAIWLIVSLASIGWILIKKWMFGAEIEGWASIMASVWLIGGIIIFLLGLIGIYLSKMFLEVKNRPLTIIKTIYRKN
jgi:putative glycosyltransferase